MISGNVILLLLVVIPVVIAYDKENRSTELNPRYVIVGFLCLVQVALILSGSILLSFFPWFFAYKVANRKSVGETGPDISGIEARGNGAQRLDLPSNDSEGSDSGKIDNLF